METNTKRSPVDPNALDSSTATLYQAAVSLGAQETQLIWNRYAGFVVINGFFVSALTGASLLEPRNTLAVLGIAILVVNCVWHILNYAGWQNQNLFYRHAGNFFLADVGLVTDFYRAKTLTPFGWIYQTAQLIPLMFSLAAVPCIASSLQRLLGMEIGTSWLASFGLWLVSVALVWVVERRIAKQAARDIVEPC